MKDNENRICARRLIRVRGKLSSPLLVGSGENEWTDMDVITAPDGTCMIPGSSLAGAMRAYITQNRGKAKADDLFGDRKKEGTGEDEGIERQSRLYVYDVLLRDAARATRNGVRLDSRKTAEAMSRYDMQILESGAEFCIRLEFLVREKNKKTGIVTAIEEDFREICSCLTGMEYGSLRVGAKSRRGYGKLHIEDIKYCDFIMDREKDFQSWLDFDWESLSSEWQSFRLDGEREKTAEHCFVIPLKVKNSVLIRDYYLKPFGKGKEKIFLDYGQLASQEKAVIPGSSWAGAVRSYLAHMIQEAGGADSWERAQEMLDPFFGTWNPQGKKQLVSSKLLFEETKLQNSHTGGYTNLARNSIDRFSGGTVKGALYHEMVWAGGETGLVIRWQDRDWDEFMREVLLGFFYWMVYGIYNGFLTVGGETSVGRGIFECPEGKKVMLDGEVFEKQDAAAAVKWCRDRRMESWENCR